MLSATMLTKELIKNITQSVAIQFNNINKAHIVQTDHDTIYDRMRACEYTMYKENCKTLEVQSYDDKVNIALYTEIGEVDTANDTNNGSKADVVYTLKYLGIYTSKPKIITVEVKNGEWVRDEGESLGYYEGIGIQEALEFVFPSDTIREKDWLILSANFILHD